MKNQVITITGHYPAAMSARNYRIVLAENTHAGVFCSIVLVEKQLYKA